MSTMMGPKPKPAWKFIEPYYFSAPLYVYVDNIIRMILENQEALFDWWNRVLELPEDNKLEPIDPANMRIGLDPQENFPSMNIIGSFESEEGDTIRTDTITFFIIVFVSAQLPEEQYKLASIYLNALQSLFETAPSVQFLQDWPPVRVKSDAFLMPRNFNKFVKVGVPTSDYIATQTGAQPVLTLELQLNPPTLR